MSSEAIHPGDVVAGKYRVRAILGRSHGLLLEAFHTQLQQRVIVKVLLPGHGDDGAIERFRREARTLSQLESEHSARILDVGTQEDGSFYLVRQYLEGVDLASYVKKGGPLPVRQAVLTILMAAEAVAETHLHGIIVRELAPQHLFLTQRAEGDPLVKISDFGTAKLTRDAGGAPGEVTATAMFGLSPYSSPELVRKARNVDVRTDVWSLGAVFYELLTGRPPFGGDAARLMLQITKEDPVPPSELRPAIPKEIDQIIAWALAKDVDARFRSVNAFAQSLGAFTNEEGQALIARIGQMAAEQKRLAQANAAAKKSGTVPPPSFGPGASPSSGLNFLRAPAHEESLTDIRDITAPFLEVSAVPPAPPSIPAPSAMGPPLGTPIPGPPPAPSWGAPPGPAPALFVPAAADGPPPMSMGKKIALGAAAFTVVLVPILIVLLYNRSSASSDEQAAASASAASARLAASAPASASVAPVARPTATAEEAASADPVDSAAPVASASDPAPRGRPGRVGGVAHSPISKGAPSGGKGTLMAVAVGGSCSFSINGAPKGTSSSLRLSVDPGTYAVNCKPESGALRSKSVVVKSGETAMAAFKL